MNAHLIHALLYMFVAITNCSKIGISLTGNVKINQTT